MPQFITLSNYAKDITGQRFGKLVALGPVGRNKHRRILWFCRCDCGATIVTQGTYLLTSETKSCGCAQREPAIAATRTHGRSGTHMYRTWANIVQRCTNPNSTHFRDYGGRGIAVCDEWRYDFQAFYDHVSQLPYYGKKGYTIDRIENDGNYEPGNVRWSSVREQNRNTRQNHLFTHNGKTQCLTDWAKEANIKRQTLYSRIRNGLSIEHALTTPVKTSR